MGRHEPLGGSGGTSLPLLTANGLVRSYGSRRALDGVSLTLATGTLTAIIGPNGAGKTTLLSVLAGALKPESGSVEQAGRVAWVPQDPALYSKLTVAENLRLFARLQRVADVAAAVTRMLSQTGLAERADDQVGSLSGGNRQRVNIAIGLLAQPAVLLLDEPAASLDPRQRERLWEFIAGLAGDGTAVLYSTHDLAEAQRHADRVLALEAGQIVFDGPAAQLEWEY